ncbi:hypothetical protein HYI19_18130 [Clostridium botulinum]|uniref:hypothetical protein n=1 Tax=Clostridium botulinum TaxID=1491 RepID=UPI0013F11F8B|nr:hypothetical protein [Clostridium botulinum]MBY6846712.1 hypothetical protein [Clostridium botulinum]NEZ80379.1 hypothetical protein [Clostridium botulinum]NFA17691.1 hypothetical protein [Clostridium botulinum]NFA54349.1 hypothetical protein [Clostridium botulinum]NFA67835.1 hypothetical protein [Clostridium botulinum]
MVTLKLIELTSDMVTYEYFPEDNRNYPGKVALDLKTNKRIFLKDSAEDFGKRYAAHALRLIEEYNSNGEFKKEGLVAWY